MRLKTKILRFLFMVIVFAAAVNMAGHLSGLNLLKTVYIGPLMLLLPAGLLFLHSIWLMSLARGLLFFLTAGFTGFIFEFFGLKYHVFFGGNYVYSQQGMKLLTVPLNVVVYWAVFVYAGYCITNTFLIWLDKSRRSAFLIPLLILLDGIFVVTIDLFLDPLQVRQGSWSWTGGGSYFGIPVGNFIGWMLVAFIVTGLFRIFEYFRPHTSDAGLKPVLILPVLGYGLLYLTFMTEAYKYQMSNLAIIGSLTMLPVVLLNLFLYTRHIRVVPAV